MSSSAAGIIALPTRIEPERVLPNIDGSNMLTLLADQPIEQ